MAKTLELDFGNAEQTMLKLKPKKVLLQLPSGTKRMAASISTELRRRFGCDVIISGDSCFGACDIPTGALESVDAVVQIGHSPMPSIRYPKPMVFIRGELTIDLPRAIDSAISKLEQPVGLLATTQHFHLLEEAKRLLERRSIKSIIGKSSSRTAIPGHILGCDYSSARSIASEASSFLLFGGGKFHSIGVKLVTKKPVIVVDPERTSAIEELVDFDSFMRRRYAVIQKLSEAKSIAVILSSKIGQIRPELAEQLLEELQKSGKEGHLILMDEISPKKLEDLGFDAYVSTACPRIAVDDSERYKATIGTPIELFVALAKMDWSDYQLDTWNFRTPSNRRE